MRFISFYVRKVTVILIIKGVTATLLGSSENTCIYKPKFEFNYLLQTILYDKEYISDTMRLNVVY